MKLTDLGDVNNLAERMNLLQRFQRKLAGVNNQLSVVAGDATLHFLDTESAAKTKLIEAVEVCITEIRTKLATYNVEV